MTRCSICKTDSKRTHDITVYHEKGVDDLDCVCDSCIVKMEGNADVIIKGE